MKQKKNKTKQLCIEKCRERTIASQKSASSFNSFQIPFGYVFPPLNEYISLLTYLLTLAGLNLPQKMDIITSILSVDKNKHIPWSVSTDLSFL